MRIFDAWALQALLFSTGSAQQTRLVFQFPKPTWLENIATTRTGHLLTGIINKAPAELHVIDPFTASNSINTTLLHSFPGVNSIFGISEYAPDHFAVATGNYSPTTGPTAGTYAVWSVDVSHLSNHSTSATVKVRKIADVKDLSVINGVAALNEDAILLADSFAGSIIRLDIKSGKHKTVINHPSTAFAPMLGVNGLKVLHSTDPPTIYYTNTQLNATFSAPINRKTGKLIGNVTTVVENEVAPDDLAVTDDGMVFFARPFAGMFVRARAGEKAVVVAGAEGSSVLGGVTSVTLGRRYNDRGVAYVATMGGFNADGSYYAEGGKIVAVDLAAEVEV
ncbi:hypothetical protein GRF29_19g2759190 [Pseudopithomyces chartarum]|uniref:SMP-30/Gluconolactonase/LRE-like region domain-containing protein n=1 Tax=Pseudopithomyces chartarum TaxID=1892770 RepID=A0AAN6RLC8_9PLEO|nr:hypothetical protein GRF29_19g2759190 [Pseudopithomyces chartarum]